MALSRLAARLARSALRPFRFPRPFIDYCRSRRPVVRRGTKYWGWWFEASDDLRQGLVVSAGAGEDISFDCAVATGLVADVIHRPDTTSD